MQKNPPKMNANVASQVADAVKICENKVSIY